MTDQDRDEVREVPLCDLRDFYETARETLGEELFKHLVWLTRNRPDRWPKSGTWPVKLEKR